MERNPLGEKALITNIVLPKKSLTFWDPVNLIFKFGYYKLWKEAQELLEDAIGEEEEVKFLTEIASEARGCGGKLSAGKLQRREVNGIKML